MSWHNLRSINKHKLFISSKVYNMNSLAKELELPGAFILGAGAVSSKTIGMNAEVMTIYITT